MPRGQYTRKHKTENNEITTEPVEQPNTVEVPAVDPKPVPIPVVQTKTVYRIRVHYCKIDDHMEPRDLYEVFDMYDAQLSTARDRAMQAGQHGLYINQPSNDGVFIPPHRIRQVDVSRLEILVDGAK